MQDRVRLLVVGDGNSPTGFARVLASVLSRLPPRFEVHHLAVNHNGDPHPHPWAMYPAGLRGDPFGVNRLAELLERVEPALALFVSDPWTISQYAAILSGARPAVRGIAYVPIEGGPMDPSLTAGMRTLARVVAYTRFGAGILSDSFRAGGPGPVPRLEVIPHGLDRDVFRPVGDTLGDRRKAKRALLPHLPEFQDSFVVFNGNRNQPRKRMDLTLKGFARFAAGKPANVKLYLHTGVEDLGWNVLHLARRLGIEDRLVLTSSSGAMPHESDEQLNLIYNVGDVGLSTAVAEGWGLVAFEHAATGAPQVLPRHSSYAELWEGTAELMEPSYCLSAERMLFDTWYVTEDTVANALERLYRDPELRAERGRRAYERACDPSLSWDTIARRWSSLFHEVLSER